MLVPELNRLLRGSAAWKDLLGRVRGTEAGVLRLERQAAGQGDLRHRIEAAERSLATLAEQNDAFRTLLRSTLWDPALAEEVRALLRLLQPCGSAGHRKIRLGRDNDGGYVMLDDFAGLRTALSLGINDDDSWDVDIARRGLDVLQFDPTVDASPTPHARFRFHKQRVSPDGAAGTASLADLIARAAEDGDILLKIDIEADEWPVLDATAEEALARCRQIVCEFHWLDRLANAAFHAVARRCFEKLARHFFVCHVHGNNCSDIVNVGNVPLPRVLEVTFANRNRYRPVAADELFPTPLDMPNQIGRADIFLGAFRF